MALRVCHTVVTTPSPPLLQPTLTYIEHWDLHLPLMSLCRSPSDLHSAVSFRSAVSAGACSERPPTSQQKQPSSFPSSAATGNSICPHGCPCLPVRVRPRDLVFSGRCCSGADRRRAVSGHSRYAGTDCGTLSGHIHVCQTCVRSVSGTASRAPFRKACD